MKTLTLAAAMAVTLAAPAHAADVEGCKDHPAFNRMPNYEIADCEAKEFDAQAFHTKIGADCDAPVQEIEGRTWRYDYRLIEGRTAGSSLQVQRNFANAVRAAGGTVVAEGGAITSPNALCHAGASRDRAALFKLTRGGGETWAMVVPFDGGHGYELFIVQRQAMQQDIVANDLLSRINEAGRVSLYLHFDTGLATIKPESLSQLDQAAQMLKAAPALKVEVAGHTDNAGTAEANLKLSQARAASVMQALVSRGIAATRLTAKGYGQGAPLADNQTEDGRAKNRRVELVRK